MAFNSPPKKGGQRPEHGRKAGRHTQGGHERPRVSSGGPLEGSNGADANAWWRRLQGIVDHENARASKSGDDAIA